MDEVEKRYVPRVLKTAAGNKTAAALVLVLAPFACAPPAARPSPPASPAPNTSAPDLCRTVGAAELARTRAAFAEARPKALAARPAGGFNPLPEELPPLFGQCFAHPGGAWLVTLDSMKPGEQWGPSLDVRWSLTHVDDRGARASLAPGRSHDRVVGPDEKNLLVGGEDSLSAELVAFDWDGDGVPEIVPLVRGKDHEGPDFVRGRVFTLKRGAVELYAPAAGLIAEQVADVDHDGLPDLRTRAGFSAPSSGCESGFDATLDGPAWLAHARPDGTFSLGDEVAAREAMKHCPAPPRPLLPAGAEGDAGVMAQAILCARIWGASAEVVLEALEAACPRAPGRGEGCPAGECQDRATLDAWARAAPPLRLR